MYVCSQASSDKGNVAAVSSVPPSGVSIRRLTGSGGSPVAAMLPVSQTRWSRTCGVRTAFATGSESVGGPASDGPVVDVRE